MKFKHILGSVVSLPLLPLLYFQGKSIRKNTPKLPEAKDPKGFVNGNFDKTVKVITIGESTIAGVGVDYHKNGFTGALANILSEKLQSNINWRVYARSGYTAKQVCKKIIPKIEESSIDIIVIGLGGNDAFTLNSPKKWSDAVESIIELLQEKYPNTPIFFTNMPPIKEFPAFTKSIKFVIGNLVEVLGNELSKIIKNKKDVFYADEVIKLKTWSKRHGLSNNNSNLYFSDGVHPSELTYNVWAQEIANFIVSKIK
jgi:lysophospholipase L1-like esterase